MNTISNQTEMFHNEVRYGKIISLLVICRKDIIIIYDFILSQSEFEVWARLNVFYHTLWSLVIFTLDYGWHLSWSQLGPFPSLTYNPLTTGVPFSPWDWEWVGHMLAPDMKYQHGKKPMPALQPPSSLLGPPLHWMN